MSNSQTFGQFLARVSSFAGHLVAIEDFSDPEQLVAFISSFSHAIHDHPDMLNLDRDSEFESLVMRSLLTIAVLDRLVNTNRLPSTNTPVNFQLPPPSAAVPTRRPQIPASGLDSQGVTTSHSEALTSIFRRPLVGFNEATRSTNPGAARDNDEDEDEDESVAPGEDKGEEDDEDEDEDTVGAGAGSGGEGIDDPERSFPNSYQLTHRLT